MLSGLCRYPPMIDSRAIVMAITVEASDLYNVRCVAHDGTRKGNKDLIEPRGCVRVFVRGCVCVIPRGEEKPETRN